MGALIETSWEHLPICARCDREPVEEWGVICAYCHAEDIPDDLHIAGLEEALLLDLTLRSVYGAMSDD